VFEKSGNDTIRNSSYNLLHDFSLTVTFEALMFNYTSSAANPCFLSEALNNLKIMLPNLVLSLVVSVVGSILLTALTYGLNVTIGIPVFPFLFVMF
jgi:hypothetical protein